MLQTMLEASSTTAPLSLKRHIVLRGDGCLGPLRGKRREETRLRHGSGLHLFLSATVLSCKDVSVLCI